MARRSKNSARSLNGHFTDPLAPRGACGGPALARGIQAERARSAGKAARSGRYLPRFLLRAGGDSVQGDFRGPEVLGRIPPALPQRRVDLVLAGAAPPLRGIDAADQLRPMCLTEAGLDRGGPGLEARAGCPDQGVSGLRIPGVRSGRPRPFRQGKADQARRFTLKCICWRRVFAWCSLLQAGPGSGVDKLPDAGSEAAFEDE